MVTVVSLRLETHADRTLRVREWQGQGEGSQADGKWREPDRKAPGRCCKVAVLPTLFFTAKLLRDL
jgi:hypothetical protein